MENEVKISELKALHKLVDEQLQDIETHYGDEASLRRLKKQKLQLKDQMESLKKGN